MSAPVVTLNFTYSKVSLSMTRNEHKDIWISYLKSGLRRETRIPSRSTFQGKETIAMPPLSTKLLRGFMGKRFQIKIIKMHETVFFSRPPKLQKPT